ncbi:hypothetical protein D9758_011191 [Tetrapyrgos nigripes]|uniref:FAD-binding PCMH-type domain-containing protein n=1 Tax=Tetrapyrgos nigripes TaxID=182062 RepID=A0A8H5D892_9AGAR|nr:hypothetical protein D9758_011191 [Tetrapyrgos nigripes]
MRLLLVLFAISLCKASKTPLGAAGNKYFAHLCCTTLSETLPDPAIVHFPGSAEYEDQQLDYFISQQTELHPSCRVSPTTSSEVSLVVKTLTEHSCPFSVRSGGHMSWRASNIARGIALDLGQLNGIDVDEKKGAVRLGPGSNWGRVYTALEPYNLSTVGGRVPEVGVGGYFLGGRYISFHVPMDQLDSNHCDDSIGGISLLSFRHGFGSDNVINYQVVLANGTLVNANATSHPDLFWALKLGSTNFGIVTRFDVFTYPLAEIWSGGRIYALDPQETPQLLHNWVSFSRKSASSRGELQAVVLGKGSVTVWHGSLDPSPSPPLSTATSITDTTRSTTLLKFLDELQPGLGDQKRTRWFTFTVKLDATFLWDVHSYAREIYDELGHVSELQWEIAIQPIAKSFMRASSETGANPFRNVLMESKEDLALILLISTWRDQSNDKAMYKAMSKLGAWSEDTARQRRILNNFLYLNYANEEQSVYARSVNQEDLARMRRVKKMYDLDNALGRLWKGGFKIPDDDSDEQGGQSAAHTEL